ncbi:hypothetical protein [Teichococcus aestuarii]|uniref:hypothetical protein n=1 Tax=Teichococcus aestuarii TaxID=568898 RepID=UPI00361D6E9D
MRLSHFVALAAATSVAACQQPDQDWANKAALQAGAPLENAAALREAQTARFPETSEQRLLVEATQVLQDLGFTIEESAPATAYSPAARTATRPKPARWSGRWR